MNFSGKILPSFVLLLLALGLRLYGITENAPQSDERHWVNRAEMVIAKLKSNPLDSTSRLGHPGLPPTMIMVAAQVINKKFQERFGIERGDALFFDELSISRIAVSSVSALLIPMVFLAASTVFGIKVAFLGAMLLAFDPMMTGSSRMAHIDATLSLLVGVCVLCYIQAVRLGSLGWKVIAGMAWGLCILVKPTSVALIPALLLVRLYMERVNLSSGKRYGIFAWSDVLVLFTGQLLMILLWTRYWYHHSAFVYQLKVRSRLATSVYKQGLWLQQNPEIVLFIVAVLLCLGLLLWRVARRVESRGLAHHSGIILLSSSFLFSTYVAFPQVYENLVRYWTWAVGLSGVRHEAFGYVVDRLKWGYLDVLVSHFNPLLLLGLLIGAVVTLRRIWRDGPSNNRVASLLLVVVPTVWILLLNVSSKQTLRYALPALSFLYVVIAIGLVTVAVVLLKLVRNESLIRNSKLQWSAICCVGLMQLYSIISFYPYYEMYFSDLSGGVKGALERGYSLPLTGQNEAVDALVKDAGTKDGTVFVTTFGDEMTLEYTLKRRHPEYRNKFNFGYFRPESADYLLRFQTIKNEPGPEWQPALSADPRFKFVAQEVELLWIYPVPLVGLEERYQFDLNSGSRNTGDLFIDPSSGRAYAEATPEKDKKGYLYFGHGIRVAPGKYDIHLDYSVLPTLSHSEKAVARFEFSSKCEMALAEGSVGDISGRAMLRCELTKEARVSPQVYWFGARGLRINGIAIKAAKLPEITTPIR